MNGPVQLVTPDRLRIQEGGGCLSVFGLPFFGAGVFLFLILLRIVPVNNADQMPAFMWPLLVLMAIAFTTVGGALVFGRSWMTIDRAQREVVKQWGLLVPLRGHTVPLEGYTAVTLGFVPGDSDTAESFPLTLKARSGPDLRLCSLSDYAKARHYARAIAEHLHLQIEDASTDRSITLTPATSTSHCVSVRDRTRQCTRMRCVLPTRGVR